MNYEMFRKNNKRNFELHLGDVELLKATLLLFVLVKFI